MNPETRSSAAIEKENARLRGDLLTVAKRVTHDLRTPLGGIVNSIEAVREVLTLHDPSAVPLADSLLRSADEMTQIIKQLSFIARATAIPLPKIKVHMVEPVFVAMQRLESRVLKRQAQVREPASWPVVAGVPTWLEMIWWQLLQNALEHGGPAPCMELGWESYNGWLRFWLRDNGPGVPDALCEKLFKEFHMLHDAPDVPGLGLAIVQRLVELQGGTCGYERVAAGGGRFFFMLPAD